MAELIHGLDAERVRANLERSAPRSRGVCARGPRPGGRRDPRRRQVRRRSTRSACWPTPASTLVGENRAQDLVAKQERWGDRLTWDFIGHLQSRKVKQVLPHVRWIHSVASDSVLAQLERHAHAGDRGAGRGQRRRRGGQERRRARGARRASSSAARSASVGLMTMPPFAEDPED